MSSLYNSYRERAGRFDKIAGILSYLTGINKEKLITITFTIAESEAIEKGIFISLPVVKTEDGYYTRLSAIADNHYTDLKIENGYFYVDKTKYIIDPMFFDEDSIRKWCRKKMYDIN